MSSDGQIEKPRPAAMTGLVPQQAAAQEDEMLKVLKRRSFLPMQYLAIVTGNSVAGSKTNITQGEWFIAGKNKALALPLVGAGEAAIQTIEGIYLAWRPCATVMKDGKPHKKSYNPKSEVFRQVIEGYYEEPYKGSDGTEVLFFINKEQLDLDRILSDKRRKLTDADKTELNELREFVEKVGGIYAVYFYKNTARDSSPAGKAEIGQRLVVETHYIEGGNFQWWGPTAFDVVSLDGKNNGDPEQHNHYIKYFVAKMQATAAYDAKDEEEVGEDGEAIPF